MDVSVVVPVHNEGASLLDTLESVAQSRSVDLEVVVVDDGSTDGGCDPLRRSPGASASLRLISLAERGGVAPARNAGAAQARADVIAFLDAHCRLDPRCLERLLEVLDRDPSCIVTPCIASAEDPRRRGYGVKPTEVPFDYRWLPRTAEAPVAVPVAAGGCLALRRELFQALEGFDSMRGLGVEDVEFSLRSWLLGHQVLVVPDAELSHRFRPPNRYRIGLDDYLHNALRTAVIHFDGERRRRVVDRLQNRPQFGRAAARMLAGDVCERRAAMRIRRRRDADWYCRRFEIAW